MLRIIYFGSSDFSLSGLRACLEAPGYEVGLVITTPPQKQGRGLELTPTLVSLFCKEKGIPCKEYIKLDDAALSEVSALKPDVYVVASYGKMIPEHFLKLVNYRFNIHPSLLPKYRGASPLNAPILAGDSETGLSIADVTKNLDAGNIYFQETEPLSPQINSEALGVLLAEKSAYALKQIFSSVSAGNLKSVPQNDAAATYAGKLSKEQGRLRFSDPAEKWDRAVRGLKPWPGAFIEILGERVSLLSVRVQGDERSTEPGKLLEITPKSMIIQTPQGRIEWLQVKPAGKKEMNAADYARGRRWQAGTLLQ